MTSTMDKKHWQPTEQLQQQWIKQQNHLYSGTIPQQTWGKVQKDIQQLWDPGAFQRE